MPSILDTGIQGDSRVAGFPRDDKDIKAIFKIAMDAVHNPKVRELLIKQIDGNPGKTPEIVARLASMLCWRIMAQIKTQMNVGMPQKNVAGLLKVIVAELYELTEKLGNPPVSEDVMNGTLNLAAQAMAQMAQQGQQQQQRPQGPQNQGAM